MYAEFSKVATVTLGNLGSVNGKEWSDERFTYPFTEQCMDEFKKDLMKPLILLINTYI